MNTRSMIRNVLFLSAFLGAAVILPYQEVIAQGERPMSTPDSRVSRELWDVWRQGFDYYEKGEMKMISTKYQESLLYYQKALEAFQEVRRQNPRWNRSVIEYRMSLCRRRILTARRRAGEAAELARAAQARAQVRFPAGSKTGSARTISGTASSSGSAAVERAKRDFEIRIAQTARENELRRKQIADLQTELARLRPSAARADSALQQIRSLMSERDQLDKQLSSLRLQLRSLQEEQRKAAPRAAELQKMLENERNKSSAYARSFRERSAAYNKLNEEFRILSAGKTQLDAEHTKMSKQYHALLKSSTEMVRDNTARQNQLKVLLEQSRKESADCRKALEKVQAEKNALSAQLATLRSGKISSEENMKQIQKEFAQLRTEQDKGRIELEKLRSDRIRLENQCVLLNGQIAQLKKDLEINMVQRNDFSKANDAISKQYAELEKSFRKSTAENVSLRKDLAKAVRERELFASKVNDQLNESLKGGLRSAQNEVRLLKEELAALKKQGNALELKAALAIAQSKTIAAGQEVTDLKGQLAALRERSARADVSLKDSQKQIAALNSQLTQVRQERDQLQKQLKSLQADNSKLAKDLQARSETALKNMVALRQQETQARTALDQALKKQLELNESQAQRLRSSNQTIVQLTETLRSQNERLSKALAESEVLKQQKNLLQSKIDQEKLLSGNKADQFRRQAEALLKQNTELMNTLRSKETELQAARKAAVALPGSGKTPESDLSAENRKLQEKIRILTLKEKELSSGGKADPAQVARLTAELTAARTSVQQAKRKVTQCEEKILLLNQELEKTTRALNTSQARFGKISEKAASDSSRILQLQEEMILLRKELASYRKQSADASGQASEAKVRLTTVQGQLHGLRDKVQLREKELAAVRNELEKTRQEFAVLKGRAEKSQADSRSEADLLKKQSKDTQKLLDRERQALAQAQKQLSQIRKDLEAERRFSMERTQEILKLKESISTLQKTLLSTGQERSGLVKELEKLKSTLPGKEEVEALRADAGKVRKENEVLRKDKSVLEQTIASLQFRLGSTQTLLEKIRKEALKQSHEIGSLKEQNHLLRSRTEKTARLEKSLAEAKAERSMLIRNAAVAENKLKTQLRQYAGDLLAQREKTLQKTEEVRQGKKKISALEKELKESSGKIAVLQKKLAEALSGEERARLVRQIRSMTQSMKVLASNSPDELVREAATKNVVITELLTEIENYKKTLAQMKKSEEASRLSVLRSRNAVRDAEEAAKVAVEGARLARAELAHLKADVLAGRVNVALLERAAPRVRVTERKKIVEQGKSDSEKEAEKVSAAKKKAAEKEAAKEVARKAAETAVKKVAEEVAKLTEKAAPAKAGKEKAVHPKLAEYKKVLEQGRNCEKSGDLGMALFHYWSAVDLQPENPEPYLILVNLHLKRKEAESAQKAYDKAVSLGAPKDPALEEKIKDTVE